MRNAHAVVVAASLLFITAVWGDDFQQGLDAYNSADYETALAKWQPLADSGDANSQFGLGQMYGNGFGVMMDDDLAIKYYGLAVQQGHAQAQCNLAVMYQNGWGVTQNDAEAAKLYTLAAEQGVTEAQVAIGRMLSMDYSEAYDPVQAYKWFSIAMLMENIDASVKRDAIAGKMTAEQIAEGDASVKTWSDGHSSLLANFQD
ncbi:MAG: sel1 repeat family protein [Proteobacteria bacterium]|nr:sel1 repeat family protein [Pseudomonadota bacterium]